MNIFGCALQYCYIKVIKVSNVFMLRIADAIPEIKDKICQFIRDFAVSGRFFRSNQGSTRLSLSAVAKGL